MSSSTLHEAEYYSVYYEEEQIVRCHLCPFECIIGVGEKGKCKARMNIMGKLYSLTYGYATMKIDKIEKQHLYHFFPNSRVQTFATYNCNLDCIFCQVSDQAQIDPETISGKKYTPEQAAMFGMASGSKVVCFGESEPLISYEWVRDAAKAAKEKGLKVVIRTNGFFNPEPIEELLEYVDAVVIEVKAVNDEGYAKICGGGSFEKVKRIMNLIYNNNKHLEVSFIVHKEIGNDEIAAGALAYIIADEISKDIPLHLVRLLPAYKTMNLAPTNQELLEKTLEKAKEMELNYVYLGNVPDHPSATTICPNCGQQLIKRTSTNTEVERVSLRAQCNKCMAELYMVLS